MTIDLLLNEPALQDIPRAKLLFIQKLFFESKEKKPNELLPFLLSVAKLSKEENIQFSEDEIDRIIIVIKQHCTPEEAERINTFLKKKKGSQ